MYQIKKWAIAMVFCGLSTVALADWERGTSVDEQETGDWRYTKCIYETLGGFRFSMINKGLCPFSVEVNPETGQVRK
ncbi:hypothetical protein PHA51_03120 [Rodentibacter pneumotropicus]|uniref:hypothetical protein n=1 Tax=Rodentibacter pneumotropicus TaxID=758 RepID=UPI00232BBBFA|nr:hypothetical protein [Rodentibacter pneumotropicus]MDC2825031.1 hypothetical protein [Rodentibacter pneumotropicus]